MPLRDAIAGHNGDVRPGFPARPRLRALGLGLAPAAGVRLERLRFDARALTAPVTCACRRITLPSGEEMLLTAIAGAVPKLTASIPREDIVEAPASAAPAADPIARLRGRGTVRFLWQTDESGRFIAHTDSLADVVGDASAALTGRTWGDIAGDLVLDPTGRISDCFARRETWSGQTVHWRIARTDRAIAVDVAGMPVFDRARHFVGFRGFGLCRTDEITEWPASAPSPSETVTPDMPHSDAAPAWSQPPEPGTPDIAQRGVEPPRSEIPEPVPSDVPQSGVEPAQSEFPERLTPDVAQHGVEPGPTEPLAFATAVAHGGVEPPPADFEDIAAVSAATAAATALQPKEALVGAAPMGEARVAVEQQQAQSRAAIPITGLRGHVAAQLGPTPVPLRPRDDHDVAPPEPSTPANDDAELATQAHLSEPKRLPLLSSEERSAFREIARSLGARFDDEAKGAVQPLVSPEMLADARVRELAAILDTATDGVMILNDAGRIVSLNRSAEALFGYDQADVAGESVAVLLAPESHEVTGGYLEGLRDSGVATLLNDGREVLGRVRQGGVIPLFMTIGRISDEPARKFCVVLRDITAFKTAEAELHAAKRAAQEASAHKSEFLTRLGDEVRTPLNAIIGFAELMREERFGPLGNERYRDAVKDIHGCGRHISKILDGLVDLAKIEAGRMELSFTGVNLNDLVANCLAEMLQQAARERIVMRTSFAPKMPAVVADERSLRQVVLNIVSNAVKFTNAGGQVIISTAMTDRGEVVLRVRDTGVGMTDDEIRVALEPLRQAAPTGQSGSGLGLALARALIEANRGALHITSIPQEGTLVEILFPPTRVLAE